MVQHTAFPSTSGLTVLIVLPNKKQMVLHCMSEQYLDGMKKYCQDGAFIQDAFPFLSASEREFLLTGMTPEEWEKFGEEE